MKFELGSYHRNTTEESLLSDVGRVSELIGRKTVTMAEYEEHGKYHPSTLKRRFGSWFTVLDKAGLKQSRSKLNIPEEELFRNIEKIWTVLGRQPKYAEVKKPLSDYSAGTYDKRFGSWLKALEKFVEYINSDEEPLDPVGGNVSIPSRKDKQRKKRTNREISDRLRFTVLMRDGFTCQSCGSSPTKERGVELHVDHILPWSKGGETVVENLQAKCKQCNLGKGNAFDK